MMIFLDCCICIYCVVFHVILGRVGIELPKVEVRYNNLRVEAECEVVQGKPLPTLWNSVKGMVLVSFFLNCFLKIGL